MPEEETKLAEASDHVDLGLDDCAIVIRKHGNVDFVYNLEDPDGKVPVSMIFANGMLLSIQEQETVATMMSKGHTHLEQQLKNDVEK